MAKPEEDEWEYEYDENETEDFYIPLDLSNVPAAQIPMVSQGRPGHPTLLKSRLRALNAARGQPAEFAANNNDAQETATMGEVQVVGLHTPNPLVMYNGQLLSCHWTSTVGTDMFFVKPDANASTQSQILRSLPSVDLLALGSAKLVAKVGRLRPRDDLVDNASDAQQATEVTHTPDDNQSAATRAPGIADAQPSSNKEGPSAPLSFLARLNEAKAKRGEKSRLSIAKTSEGSRLVAEKATVSSAGTDTGTSQTHGDSAMGGT
ncbi:uncharacterized protein ALTATR162_LOCUS5320 [Alternaria atra]|jgi:hypothetical protein|uniref:Transcription factor TFIIIC triple barrel domain-containing protein n=1 Tax=Alternaria atra TaxID=119953 RepID=A0A8J2I042_9PLEO|nr:uncharacterized protein ALTATR162_LOCUS5320 [Alternaria atra]CAG5158921.1 unnamed protein product [Alternaria atra]